jgi:hypothetical protein
VQDVSYDGLVFGLKVVEVCQGNCRVTKLKLHSPIAQPLICTSLSHQTLVVSRGVITAWSYHDRRTGRTVYEGASF